MKNSMFLMLVLLHITSQPSIASGPLVISSEFKGVPAWLYENYEDRVAKKHGFPQWHHITSQSSIGPDILAFGALGIAVVGTGVAGFTARGLYETSQTAQPLIGSGILIAFGAVGMAAAAVGFKACRKWYTHSQGMRCVEMSEGRNRDECVNCLLTDPLNDQQHALQIVKKNKLNIDATGKCGVSAIRLAVLMGELKTVRLLLEAGSSVNQSDLLGCAIRHKKTPIVALLLRKRADVNYLTYGSSPLQKAIESGIPDMAACFINYGVEMGEGDTGSCLNLFRSRGCPIKECSQNQFEEDLKKRELGRRKNICSGMVNSLLEDLKKRELGARTNRCSDMVNGWFSKYRFFSKELVELISEFAVDVEISNKDLVRLVAPTVTLERQAKDKRKNKKIRNKLKAVAIVTIPAIAMFFGHWKIELHRR